MQCKRYSAIIWLFSNYQRRHKIDFIFPLCASEIYAELDLLSSKKNEMELDLVN